MLSDDVWQTTVSHRALVEIGIDQYYAAVLQPFVHLLARKTPLSLLTAKQAASAVDGRIEGRLGLGAI
jgi:hypothetical protein